jgi:hypothetical protein
MWGFKVGRLHLRKGPVHSKAFLSPAIALALGTRSSACIKFPCENDEKLLRTKYLSPGCRFLNNVELKADRSYISVDDMLLNSCSKSFRFRPGGPFRSGMC